MGHSSQQGLGQEGGSDLRQGGEYEASNRVRIGSISVEWNTQSNFNMWNQSLDSAASQFPKKSSPPVYMDFQPSFKHWFFCTNYMTSVSINST